MLSVIKQLKIDKRIRTGYSAAFILLLVSYLFTLLINRQLMEQTRAIIIINSTITDLGDLSSNIKDAETGVRGYLLMNDTNFLEPYNASSKKLSGIFSKLRDDFDKENARQQDIDILKSLVAKRYKYLEYGLMHINPQKLIITDTIANAANQAKDVMDSITALITTMHVQKTALLIEKKELLNSRYKAMNIFIIASLLLIFLFAFFSLLTYVRENNARRLSDNQVIQFQKQLQLRIDELDSANKELVQMRRIEKFAATGRIARSIAHEVRNPLTNIDLAVGQIRAELPVQDDNFTMLFDMVNRNSKRINQLITELLNATRFAELFYEPVSVNELLDEALELAKDRIALSHIEIEKKYDSNNCDITADKEKLKIAFLNIIVNAVEAMENNGGILKINTRDEQDNCLVEIIDNGIGMDAVALSKLFEPYFTTKQKGNGLGLTNTQNIILNHKGNVNVDSEPGVGTTFTIRFYNKDV